MSAAIDQASSAPWGRAVRVERSLALAAPVPRALWAGSAVMAVVSCAANLAVLDTLEGDEALRIALHSATVPALVFSLLAGAYTASADRRTGFVDQRLLTDASRRRWLGAKAAVQVAIGVLYGVVGALTAIVTSTITFAVRDASFDATSPVVARSLLGVVGATALFALLGVAFGSLTANTAGAIGGLLAWVLVIEPPTVLGVPELGRYLPSAAGLALTASPDAELLGQLPGGLVLVAYAVAALALARWRLAGSDL